MNTWDLIQLQQSSPELFGLKQGWGNLGFMSPEWLTETTRDTYKDQDPQQVLATYASAPGRLGSLFQGIAAGSRPKDTAFMQQMYSILQSATPEERAWLQQNPDWMQAYGKLEGAGAIKDTGSGVLNTFADKVLQPLTKAAVGGAIGLGGLGALGYGPLAGGTWQGFGGGLAGSEGAETLAGGAGGDTLAGMSGLTGNAAMDAALGPLGDFSANTAALAGGGASLPSLGLAGLLPAGWGAAGTAGASLWDKAAGMPGKALDKIADNPLGALSALGGAAMGLGAASGTKNATTTTESAVDPRYWGYAEPMLQTGLGMLPGQLTQTQAMQPGLNATLGGLLGAPNVESNPWVRGWGNALAQDAWGQWEQEAIPSIASAFSRAGRYGGQSGGNMAYSNAVGQSAGNVARGLNANLAGLYSGAYGQGLSAAQGGLTQAPAVSQMGWLPLTNYSSLLGSLPWSKTSTQTIPNTSNPWAGALGGALTGASLWKNLSGG